MHTQVSTQFCMQPPKSFESPSNVIFDLDGTLIDSAPSILECFRMTLDAAEYPLSLTMDQSLIGPPLRDAIKSLSNENDSRKLDALVEKFKTKYDSGICNLALAYQGVEGLLSKLKKSQKKIFIVTNKRYIPTIKIISHLGWSHLIDDIYTVDYPSYNQKKKSSVLDQMLLDHSLQRADTCYVGDRKDDYEAAYLNGLKFIHALWGYGDADFSVPHLYSVDSPNQLSALLV